MLFEVELRFPMKKNPALIAWVESAAQEKR